MNYSEELMKKLGQVKASIDYDQDANAVIFSIISENDGVQGDLIEKVTKAFEVDFYDVSVLPNAENDTVKIKAYLF